MFDLATWITDKFAPVPHADELRGMRFWDVEKYLRRQHGYSRTGAKRFLYTYKHRLELSYDRQ